MYEQNKNKTIKDTSNDTLTPLPIVLDSSLSSFSSGQGSVGQKVGTNEACFIVHKALCNIGSHPIFTFTSLFLCTDVQTTDLLQTIPKSNAHFPFNHV